MVIVPHPDDELGAGGTLYEFAARGLSTGLITLTRGEKGRTLGLCAPEDLGEMRRQELARAAADLRVGYFEHADFPDSGSAAIGPDPYPGIPRGTGKPGDGLPNHPEAVDFLRERLAAFQPRIVITFPPDGSNGHADHVATSRFVREAWAEASPASVLYFYAYDGPLPAGVERKFPVTHRIELSREAAIAKLRAQGRHQTQALSGTRFLQQFPERTFFETFHLPGYPGPVLGELL